MSSKPRAYVYIRWSSSKQTTGDSLRRQQEGIEEFTRRTGIEISESFTDAGISAFSGKNLKMGALKELTDKVNNGIIRAGDFIVVEGIDRLTRQNVWKSISMLEKILTLGVKIYTTSDHMIYHNDPNADPRNSFGNFMYLSMIAQRSFEESSMKRERLRSVWEDKRKNAIENLKKGKVLTKRLPIWLSFENGEFVIDNNIVYDIKKLMELLKHNGLDTSIRLLEEKYKKSNHIFYSAYVSSLLKDKRLYGVIELNSTSYDEDGKRYVKKIEEIEGYYPKIISEAELKEVHEIVSKRDFDNNRGNWSNNKINIFRNIVKCGHCGKQMTFKTANKSVNQKKAGWKGKFFYLKCVGIQTGRCHSKSVNYDRFENAFIEFFNLFNLDNIFNESTNDKILSLKVELDKVSEDFFALKRKQENIAKTFNNFIEKGLDIPDSFVETASTVDKELKEVESKKDNLSNSLKFEESVASERFTSNNLKDALTDEEKRRKLNSYFKSQKMKLHIYQSRDDIYVIADNLEKSAFSKQSPLNDEYAEEQIKYWLTEIGREELEKGGILDEDIIEVKNEIKKRYYEALNKSLYIVYSYNKRKKTIEVNEEEVAIGQYFIGDFIDVYNQEDSSTELKRIFDEIYTLSIWEICEQVVNEKSYC